ncbi:T9SS type A sorting domain-containing protein [Hymenobacter sp. ASUV-10]|uniref:T9SS type A sorting domain-containing protein n=1 Tax=Hymenobacter aranciens TaxID=3063996 RepID=A0ABT9BF71_9BACT|nr:T9SS type A sorting domain-containing protein [Hymenobacter sp. ASUV-10]MDO7876892.1 T9SS type A sorting domain-containing protein [Hymenobacter sp. ASUV-10]
MQLPIGPTCTPVTGTTEATTVSLPAYTSGSCVPSVTAFGFDVWYRFTTPGTAGPHSLRLTTTGLAAGRLLVYSGTSPGVVGALVGCIRAPAPGSLTPPLDLTGLPPATSYLVRVDDQAYYGNNYYRTFTICAAAIPGCLEPTAVSITGRTTTSAVLNATLRPNQTALRVTYTAQGSAPQTVTIPAASLPYTFTGLLPGRPYTLSLTGDCGGSFSPPLVLRFETLITNDEPAGALPLTLAATCTEVSGLIGLATRSPLNGWPAYVCGTGNGFLRDVWYTFTTPASGPGSTAARLTLTSTEYGVLQVLRSSTGVAGPFSIVGCAYGDNSQTLVLDLAALTPSTQYYVQVGRANGPSYPVQPPMNQFTLCLTSTPSCPQPTNLTIRTTDTEAEINFVPTPGAGSYSVAYGPLTGSLTVLTPAPATAPILLRNLFPNTTYQVLLSADCGNGDGSITQSRTFTTNNLLPPANDRCTNAVPVGCGQTVLGTNTLGATGIGAPLNGPTCGSAPLSIGIAGQGGPVYYRLTGTGDSVVVSTCHPHTVVNNSTAIHVYMGRCDSLVCVGSRAYTANQTICPGSYGTTVGFRSVADSTYYILISPTSRNRLDQYGLTIGCVALPCLPPQQLAVVPRADSTATVSFVLPAAAVATGSFTATATPVGGTGALSTVTGSTSPLTLAGLTPGTAYTVTVTSNCPAGTATSASTAFSTPLASRAALSAQVQLFPNPAHATATLLVPAGLSRQGSTLLLYNSLGQLVRQQALPAAASTTHAELRLLGLPTGVYTLRLATSQGTILKRLVVE